MEVGIVRLEWSRPRKAAISLSCNPPQVSACQAGYRALYGCIQATLLPEQLFLYMQYPTLCVLNLWVILVLCAQGGGFAAPASTDCLTLINTPWGCNYTWCIRLSWPVYFCRWPLVHLGGFSRWFVHQLSQPRSGLICISIGSEPIFPDGTQSFCSIIPGPRAGGGTSYQATDQDAAEQCHSRHSCSWCLPLVWLEPY